MSFLEKEDGGKSSSFWDWVVGIVLVLLIGGFTVFYQYQKRLSASRFSEADAVFQEGKFKEAETLYEALKSAQYLTTQDDSIIYARLDTIETVQEAQNAAVAEARRRLAEGDSTGLSAQLARIPHRELLSPEDAAWVDSLTSHAPVASKP